MKDREGVEMKAGTISIVSGPLVMAKGMEDKLFFLNELPKIINIPLLILVVLMVHLSII